MAANGNIKMVLQLTEDLNDMEIYLKTQSGISYLVKSINISQPNEFEQQDEQQFNEMPIVSAKIILDYAISLEVDSYDIGIQMKYEKRKHAFYTFCFKFRKIY